MPHTATPPPTRARPQGPPPRRSLLGELRTVREPARLLAAAPRLRAAPRGDGRLVIDVPGWLAPEASMAPLRAYLRWLGHDARGWGLGANEGTPERDADRLAGVLDGLVAATGRPAALVGWSLGGVIAREVARARPDLVHAVATFGTPVIGGPTHTRGAAAYGPQACARIATLQEELDRTRPLEVRVTAVFTRRDAVVDWRACLDHASEDVHHVEVGSTHLGLGLDPSVWLAVARAVA